MPDSLNDLFEIRPIGIIRSELSQRENAPNQGWGCEDAPDAYIEIDPTFNAGLEGISIGSDIIVITWFHEARRDILKLHPRRDNTRPVTGVFSTRSPDRPNPIGLHRVTVLEMAGNRIKAGPLEAIDGTPVVDIKPVQPDSMDW